MTYINLVPPLIYGELYHGIFVVTAMITTVTTISTITTIATVGLSSTISLATVFTLIVFLGTRELASSSHSRFYLRLAKAVSISIWTLATVFAIILAVKIAELL